MFQEFKEFALKGNMVDMAIGIVIGGAFATIISSLVADIIMPPVGLLLGGVDFSSIMLVLQGDGPYATPEAAAEAGAVTMNIGLFINALISFLVIGWVLFLLVRTMNRLKREEEEAPAEPEAPPRSEVLLEEIRDLLKKT